MSDKQEMENIELILYSLKRPSFFSIQKVEDFYLFFNGYCAGKNDSVLRDFLDNFHEYVKNNYAKECIKEYDCQKIVRLHSANDYNSLQLLNVWINEFIRESDKK